MLVHVALFHLLVEDIFVTGAILVQDKVEEKENAQAQRFDSESSPTDVMHCQIRKVPLVACTYDW